MGPPHWPGCEGQVYRFIGLLVGPPGLLNGDDEVDSESEADDDAEQGEVQVGARLNNAQLPPPLPSLHEVHVTRVFTHKWPP